MSIFVFLQINNQYMLKDNEPASHGLVKIEQTPLRPDRQNCRVLIRLMPKSRRLRLSPRCPPAPTTGAPPFGHPDRRRY